ERFREMLFSSFDGLLCGSLGDFLSHLNNLDLDLSLVVRTADEQLHRRLNVAVQSDHDLVLASRLDGMVELDTTTINVDIGRNLDGFSDHLGGYRTEQLPFFAHLSLDLDERAFEGLFDLSGITHPIFFALGDIVLA